MVKSWKLSVEVSGEHCVSAAKSSETFQAIVPSPALAGLRIKKFSFLVESFLASKSSPDMATLDSLA